MTPKEFKYVAKEFDSHKMSPPVLSPQECLDILQEYLLGKDWYIVSPVNQEQVNVEIVKQIMDKYVSKAGIYEITRNLFGKKNK